ncbi:hypothetical protein B0H67DRAFT_649990 [Lasiosphaeris hirsuta]|uniref:Uncharacterized protein n=1 Tax=Lasiosphaeris hirsuta TaxID=260670 RepID=A0AA40DLI4_9PEZI|nr:hypothetical protein B0H67DRAFT_649990 [Lasiosphaeris hirsuta]
MTPGVTQAAINIMRATILAKAQAQALKFRAAAIIVLLVTAIAGLASAYIIGTPQQRRGKE